MRKAGLILIAAAGMMLGQVSVFDANPCFKWSCYWATVSATVAASGTTTLTIQQPATGGRQINYTAAIIQCSTQSFNVDQSQNGTAATTTAGTSSALIPTTLTSSVNVFTASNVGAGTAVAPTLSYASGSVAVLDISQRTTGLSGTVNNYSIKLTNTGGSNCTGTISVYWVERQ